MEASSPAVNIRKPRGIEPNESPTSTTSSVTSLETVKKSSKTCLTTSSKTSSKSNKSKQASPPKHPIITVAPEELAETVYKELKMSFPEPMKLEQVENVELFRQRGNLRPLRKSSVHSYTGENMEYEEDEETEGDEEVTTEEEEEVPLTPDIKHKQQQQRTTSKDDVVHCMCSNNVDEGFMIQVGQIT